MSLYGTRDAAQHLSVEDTQTLEQAGSFAGKASPCNFTHRTRDLSVTVHGDDFTTTGPESELIWLRSAMEQKYEIKSNILGPEPQHAQEMKILGRILRWIDQGIEFEADKRHVEAVLEDLDLNDCRPVSTPYGPEEQACIAGEGELLGPEAATRFRGVVARLNYLSADRADLQYAVKEAAKRMATPRIPDVKLLKRIGRYLKGAPRVVQLFVWQKHPTELTAYVDSDWAGDRGSRKSTSGGMMFRGRH